MSVLTDTERCQAAGAGDDRSLKLIVATLALLVAACTSGSDTPGSTSATSTGQSTTTTKDEVASSTTTTTPPEPPAHRIAVRIVDGQGEFYEVASGERFVPRGMNYNRWITIVNNGIGGIADDLLTVDHYDPATVEADFAEMESLGFNTVRILIDNCYPQSGCAGMGPAGPEVNPGYLDNLADFLRIAGEHGLVVLVGSNTLPDNSYWIEQTAHRQDDFFQGSANEFLNPESVPFYIDYWHQLVQGLVDRGAHTENVLGYELRQEHYFWFTDAPLSRSDGLVTTANGQTYDMAIQKEKDRMIDEGLTYWADLLRDDIRSVDPTALVTVGFFTPNYPNQVNGPDEQRLVRTAYFLRNSSVDFVDIHHYPGNGVDNSDIWENFGIAGSEEMPLLLGEYGAIKEWFPDAAAGAAAVEALEVEACRLGIDGFLVWAWRGDRSVDIYWASQGAADIAQVVAPINRPDPCQFGHFDFIEFNVAEGATATASSENPGFEASHVNDGRTDHWNATGLSPQWVELRLAQPATVSHIDLVVAQDPPGPSVHQVWVQVTGGGLELAETFTGTTHEADVLTYRPGQPIENVEVVRVTTTKLGDLSPAWHEISIWSPYPPGE